jgi:hypothetical protein
LGRFLSFEKAWDGGEILEKEAFQGGSPQ